MIKFTRKEIKKPEDIPNAFITAWNLKDAKMLAGIFDDDAEFINVTGLWWHDRESIFKAHDYGLKVIFKDSKLSLRKVKVKYLSDAIAVVNARIHLQGQTEINDQTLQARNTIFTFVVHREGGSWTCASAQNTDIVPGKETNIIKEDGSLESVNYRENS